MNKKLIAVLVIVLILPLIACTQSAVPGAFKEVIKLDKARITSPNVNPSEEALLVEGNSAFAFELHKALRGKEGNLLECPVASHWRWR